MTDYIFKIEDVLELAEAILEKYYVYNDDGADADYCRFCQNKLPYYKEDTKTDHSPECVYLLAGNIKQYLQ